MKDALGHGSGPRGGVAHQTGVNRVGQLAGQWAGKLGAFASDTRGSGQDFVPEATAFLAKYGSSLDPQTIGELPATRIAGWAMHVVLGM